MRINLALGTDLRRQERPRLRWQDFPLLAQKMQRDYTYENQRNPTSGVNLRAMKTSLDHLPEGKRQELGRGRLFFTEIMKDGVIPYEAPDHPFARAAKLSREEAYGEAQANFDKWFVSAGRFLDAGEYLAAKGGANEAAFQFHQAAERFYHCALLTMTLYSTKSPNLTF